VLPNTPFLFQSPIEHAATGGAITYNWSNTSSSGAVNNAVTTFNVGSTNPAGSNGAFTAGHLLIACAVVSMTAATDPGIIFGPAGWTQIFQTYYSAMDTPVIRVACFWHLAGGSETGSYTFSWTNPSRGASWALFDVHGQNAVPIDGSDTQNNNYSANRTAPSISPSGSSDMLVAVFFDAGSGSPYTKPSDMTLISDVNSTSSDRPEILVSYKTLSASGATGTEVAIGGVTQSVGGMFAITP
jgi:hypothetical protein